MENKFLKKITTEISILNIEFLFYFNGKQQGQLQE